MFAEQAAEYLRDKDSSNRPPIVLIPGLLSSRLIAWKNKKCRGPDIGVQDVVWLNLQKMVETTLYDKTCWIECLKLGKNGSDPKDCKVRPDEGLSAISELSPGNLYAPPATSIFTPLIKYLAELGYDTNTLLGSPYDWRLSPRELEKRDSFFTTLKFRLETVVKRHRRPAIVIAHSMGNNLFLYFCDWLRLVDRPPMGHRRWLRRHIFGFVGFAAPLLGAPIAIKSVLSGHAFGLTISEAQARELQLTFASTHFLNPRSTPAQRARSGNANTNTTTTSSGSGATQDYEVPIVSIKSATGGSSVQFGMADVENGEIFRWVASMFGCPLMMDKYSQLFSLYHDDPLEPLQHLPRRPPIRHVMMVYGVDLQTEAGYVYRLEKNAADGSVLPPVLAEIMYEETVCQDGGGAGAGAGTMGSAVSNVARSAPQCAVEESYAVAARRPADSESGGDLSVVGGRGTCPAETAPHTDLQPSSEPQSPGAKAETRICRVDIVSRSRRTGRTGVHVGRGKTIKASAQRRSGDVTVPYLSLSYAHAWLDVDADGRETVGGESDDGAGPRRWHEHRPERVHRHVLEDWGMGSIGSRVATVDPSVDLYHSVQPGGDSTVVVEVSGIDHLDISKHNFVHKLVFEMLLPRMGKELALGAAREPEKVRGEPPTMWAQLRGLLGLGPARRDAKHDADEELAAFEFLVPSHSRSLDDDLLAAGRAPGGVPGLDVSGRKRAMVRAFLRRLRRYIFCLKRNFDALLITFIRMQGADSYY